jgi:hypothetical protein
VFGTIEEFFERTMVVRQRLLRGGAEDCRVYRDRSGCKQSNGLWHERHHLPV